MEVTSSTKDHSFFLAGSGEQVTHMGQSPSKRVDRSRLLSTVQATRRRHSTSFYSLSIYKGGLVTLYAGAKVENPVERKYS
jgi:hypothetical protein